MELLLQGIILGLSLTILIGPVFFAIVQSSLETGKRAGIFVGTGIWISDFLFIVCTYFGIAQVKELTDWQNFELVTGIIGGIILMAFGINIFFTKVNTLALGNTETSIRFSPIKYFLKGFFINTVNPFTVIFWIGISTTVLIDSSFSGKEASWFYSGILGTLIITDSLKAVLSDWLRHYLSVKKIVLFRRISGSALILFGVILIFKVL